MHIPTLRTERLLLRPHRRDDFETYAEMNADPDVMRYIDAVQDRATAFKRFCANIGHWEVRGYGGWALEEVSTGKVVGRAGIIFWEDDPAPEIGYALHPSAWGKGYAGEAAARALRYAHEDLGMRGLVSIIHPDNAPSIRVAERLGARHDRDVVLRGQSVRIYLYADP